MAGKRVLVARGFTMLGGFCLSLCYQIKADSLAELLHVALGQSRRG